MNTKKTLLVIVLSIVLVLSASSTELTFLEEFCVVGKDCTLNDLFLTGNFTFLGQVINVTILNQNITGQVTIGGSLNVDGNVTADNFFGDGSFLSNLPNSSLWNRSGTNVFLRNINDNVGIGTGSPNDALEIIGNVRISGSLNASSINATRLNINNTLFVNDSRVGIGTNIPFDPLHIIADLFGDAIRLEENSGGEFQTIEIDANGDVTFSDDTPSVKLKIIDNTEAIDIPQFLRHLEDVSTYLQFLNGDIHLVAEGLDFIRLIKDITPSQAIINTNNVNIDFRVRSENSRDIIYTDASAGTIGINKSLGTETLDVAGTFNVVAQPTRTNDLFVASSGNVGIGTGNPTDTLTVIGTLNITGNVSLGTNDVLFVDNTSNRVGIGTDNPIHILEVNGNLSSANATFGTGEGRAYFTNGNLSFSEGERLIISLNQFAFSANTFPLTGLAFRGSPARFVFTDTSGVEGHFISGQTGDVTIQNDRYVWRALANSNVGTFLNVADQRWEFRDTSANPFVVINFVTENLGIGINVPVQRLEVDGYGNFTGTETSNTTFNGDVKILGTLYGGSPVKIGGINISHNVFTLMEDLNKSSRFTIQNLNNGSNASAAVSAKNNVDGTMSIFIGSDRFMVGTTNFFNATALVSRAKGIMAFVHLFDETFKWFINTQDDNDPNNIVQMMSLNSSGLDITNNLTVNGILKLPTVLELSPQGSTVLRRNHVTNVVGVKFGIGNDKADISDESGAGYVTIQDCGNYTVDAHSSLDTNDPSNVVHHLRGCLISEKWRLHPNDSSTFNFEGGVDNSIFQINRSEVTVQGANFSIEDLEVRTETGNFLCIDTKGIIYAKTSACNI